MIQGISNLRLAALLAIVAVMTSHPGLRAASDKVAADELSARLDAIVQKGIEKKVFPGAALVVGTPDKILYQKAFGHTSYETTAPEVTLDTMWDLASMSKVVGTATAAMLLIEDGKLKLDDRVASRVKEFDVADKQQILVKDLLTHVSGLPSYANYKDAEKQRKEGESHADALIRLYAGLKLKYDTRTTTVYSCLNMQTMARVNENASGKRQEDLLKERVYKPLGMKDTVYVLNDDQKKRCAPTVKRADGSMLVAEVHDPLASYHKSDQHCPGNAGLFSTARDLNRYCQMILNGGTLNGKRVLKRKTIEMMTRSQMPEGMKSQRGLGWDIYEEPPYVTPLNHAPETLVIGHTGYTGTLFLVDKKARTFVVFLTNRVYPDDAGKKGVNISSLRKEVADAVLRSRPDYAKHFAEQKQNPQ